MQFFRALKILIQIFITIVNFYISLHLWAYDGNPQVNANLWRLSNRLSNSCSDSSFELLYILNAASLKTGFSE